MTPVRHWKPILHTIAQLVADGRSDKQIAARVHLSTHMVRVHLDAIAFLCEVDRSRNIRVQIGRWWERNGSVEGLLMEDAAD